MKKTLLLFLLIAASCGGNEQCVVKDVNAFCKSQYGTLCYDLDTNNHEQMQTFKICNRDQKILNRYFSKENTKNYVSYDLDHKVIGAVADCSVYGNPCIPF